MGRDVLVTGVGALTPVGPTAERTWRGVRAGESGIAAISRFDPADAGLASRIAGEVAFDPDGADRIDERTMGRCAQFAVAASGEALADAGLAPGDWPGGGDRVGVSVGAGMGGFPAAERAVGGDRVDPYFPLRFLPNLPAGHVSEAVGARGPNRAPATACAAGTHAIGEAARDVRAGRADVMIAGGTEAALTPTAVRGFDAMRALSTRNGEPSAASRPFDADRDGFVLAEGAGVVVLEAADHAAARGATPVAALTGYARTADANHPTRPPDDAAGLRRSMERALADAGRDPAAVDHVNAHATSTPAGDAREATAVGAVFDEVPPVTSVKGTLGHALGAGGAIEAVVTATAVDRGVHPPTVNYVTPDPDCDVPVVTSAREGSIGVAVSNSAGFGGANGTLVVEEASGYGA